ncbi:tungsten cofactor oxidoreductase radical SAM maturase [Thermohalobacter berrensis]|uniref:Tungsten cofactor oxidoreductase radical SAM maturase n=1 Tax=Thermohalobacter berrensis TaxID=99594 RepID=A0A419SUB8_9FIRM|nr:tungsten cofactor oxidoreductase radical SAM maturase [Thermohalobacter berrensis]
MKKIYLELTDRCNLNCTICYRRNWKDGFSDMSKDTFNKFLKDIKDINGLEEIVLGGIGEPTIYEEILEVLTRLKEYNLNITTNGTLLTNSLVEKIVDTVKKVTISVDGVGKQFEDIRGTNLRIILEGIKRIQELKNRRGSSYPNIQLQFVSSSENVSNIFKVMDLAKEIGCFNIIVSHLLPQTEENKDTILYTIDRNDKLKNLWNKIRNYSFRKGIKIYLPNVELKTERNCDFIRDVTTYITAKGEVVPCYRFSHDSKEYVFGREKNVKKHSFGNIMDKSILDIWNSKEYREFRYYVYTNQFPSCPDCDLVEGCEYQKDTLEDCYGLSPSCGDCMWARRFVKCP